MVREQLRRASELLREASEHADGDLRDRLYEQSDQLARLATAERGPDHGRLDRHMNALYEMLDETDGEVHERVRSAREAVSAYRETVEGV